MYIYAFMNYIFCRQLSHFEMEESTDNTNVSFFPLKDELYTATERNFINRIDPDTLDRLEKVKNNFLTY